MQMDENESFAIVPQAVTLIFRMTLPAVFYTKFLEASRNLKELGLVFDPSLSPPSAGQQAELLQAIRTNRNLHRLQVGCLDALAKFWEELLEVIGSHSSLRAVVFCVREPHPDKEQLNTLIPFLQKHRHLDISFKFERLWPDSIRKIKPFLEPVRLLNCANDLTRQSIDDRPALFGTALTCWASGDSSRFYLLLSENADLLCSLLGDQPSGQTQHRRKRHRPR
jgi:hypothetical protein